MPSVNTAETENMATVTFGSSLIFYNVRDGASCSAPPQVYAPSLSTRMEIHSLQLIRPTAVFLRLCLAPRVS